MVSIPMRVLRPTLRPRIALLLCALAPTACDHARPNPTPPYIMRNGPGDASVNRVGGPDGAVIFRYPPEPQVDGLWPGVNPYLWRGALLTLGTAPLVVADPFGGVIVTDWHSPPGDPDERFKETAFILDRTLRSDAVRVSAFRQIYRDRRWVDARNDPVIQADLQNKVIERARILQATASTR
jgi:Domain of unknown function (DUF3576)